MDKDRERLDKEFWTAWLALSQTLTALREALKECRGGPSEKSKPPKGPAVALSTTCQEFYIVSGECQDDVKEVE